MRLQKMQEIPRMRVLVDIGRDARGAFWTFTPEDDDARKVLETHFADSRVGDVWIARGHASTIGKMLRYLGVEIREPGLKEREAAAAAGEKAHGEGEKGAA